MELSEECIDRAPASASAFANVPLSKDRDQVSPLIDQIDHPKTDHAISLRVWHPIDVDRDGVNQGLDHSQQQDDPNIAQAVHHPLIEL